MTEYPYIYRSPMRESFYAFLDYKTSVKQKTFHYAFLFKQFDTFLMRRKYETDGSRIGSLFQRK